ncbi:MAG: (2Fe-2S)-binding protein [Candidatus Limnocylindrales bacterium]
MQRGSSAPGQPDDGRTIALHLRVDGEDRSIDVPADRLLIDVLRSDLGLTGTKEGCGVGVCGACTIISDGRLLSSCIVLAAAVQGADITTVEGLAAPDGSLSALQEAFIRFGGFQCGICTPGQLVAATALLDRDPSPSEMDVRAWLAGNLCRCTGYRGIIEAVLQAAEVRRQDRSAHVGTG